MSIIGSERIDTEFIGARQGLKDRIAAAELEIEAVLKRHGVKFAINVVRVGEHVVHQEIVLVDQRD